MEEGQKKGEQTKMWKDFKKKLKLQGKLRPKDGLDSAIMQMEVPAFPDRVITCTVDCGYFQWTFNLLNKQIHGKNFGLEQEEDDGEMDAGGGANQQQINDHAPVVQLARRRGPVFARRNRRVANNAAEGEENRRGNIRNRIKRQLMRSRKRQFGTRTGFMLQADCRPPDRNALSYKKFEYWKVIASIKTAWKGTKRDDLCKKVHLTQVKKCNIVFSSKETTQMVRMFGPMALKKTQTLMIYLRVFKIAKVGIWPKFHMNKAPGRVCIRANDEFIYVHKEALCVNSSVFRGFIQSGLGTSDENPIRVEERFTPSLVRLAIRVVMTKARIDCTSVPELLDFGSTYKMGLLLGELEDSLINRRKCIHFKLSKKIELAYKYDLHQLICTFAQAMDTTEQIEDTLKKYTTLRQDFKDILERKLAAMRKEEEEIRLKKREKRKQVKQQGRKKKKETKLERNKRKLRNAEKKVDGVRKGVEKLRIEPGVEEEAPTMMEAGTSGS